MSETPINVYDLDQYREQRVDSVEVYDNERVDFRKSQLQPTDVARQAVSAAFDHGRPSTEQVHDIYVAQIAAATNYLSSVRTLTVDQQDQQIAA